MLIEMGQELGRRIDALGLDCYWLYRLHSGMNDQRRLYKEEGKSSYVGRYLHSEYKQRK